ncbi:MFS transporter [Pyxidicoccus parkwayensis]|uniref:MFS transporter n=1 Tax=Pyxidicoccus parkwayensis TaxID=2813578 RepID=A0ABX7P9R2_9BACT|nr:MFS transporter [Pyxidicoccus parkwaysis]QSQ27163.1 MFS transporter [Pyxidicoccus parkwaysis]
MISRGLRAVREMYELTRGLGNLRVLMVSGLVGTVAGGLLNPVMPLYLQSRGLDLQGIGLVYSVGSLVPIFLQPVMGALSDRYSRKGFVVGLSLVTSLLVPVMALFAHPLPLAAALSLKLLLQRSAQPVNGALVADFAPKQKRATIFALLDASTSLMFVLALGASAFVIRLLSTQYTFFLAGALFLVSSLLLLRLEEPAREAPKARAQGGGWKLALDAVRAPVDYVRGAPRLAGLFAWQFFFAFALNLFPIYIPLYAMKLGAPSEAVGPLVAVSWLVYAFAQPFGGRLSDGLQKRNGIILAGLAGMVLMSGILGLSGWLPAPYGLAVMVVSWALLAVPDGLHRPSAQAVVVEVAPTSERGRFLGALGGCAALAQVLAPLTYGFVARHAGLSSAFLLSSGALLLSLAGMAWAPERSAPAAVTHTPVLTPSQEPG